MNLDVRTALLLLSLSWVCVSGSGLQTVGAQSGGNVLLDCSDMAKDDGPRFWFRLVNRTNFHCISYMARSEGTVRYCEGFSQDRFTAWSRVSKLTLKIQSVDLDDSGLYFCGVFLGGRPQFSLIHLQVNGSVETQNDTDRKCEKGGAGTVTVVSVISGAVALFLMMVIIGLIVQNRKLKTVVKEMNQGQSENKASADLNYAAVSFQPKARRREPEPNVVYAATR